MVRARKTAVVPAKKAPAKAAPAKATPAKTAPATANGGVDWSTLAAPSAVEYTFNRGPAPYDAEKDTPAEIKSRVLESFKAWDADNPRANWRQQICPTADVAEQLLKAMRKYAKARDPQLTIRAGIDPKTPNVLKYSVKPFEARERKN